MHGIDDRQMRIEIMRPNNTKQPQEYDEEEMLSLFARYAFRSICRTKGMFREYKSIRYAAYGWLLLGAFFLSTGIYTSNFEKITLGTFYASISISLLIKSGFMELIDKRYKERRGRSGGGKGKGSEYQL